MILLWFGSIPLGSDALTAPEAQTIARKAVYAQYQVTRGKPVLHEIGEQLDTQNFDFFFSEEFCSPGAELAKLEAAYAMKTPLPLLFPGGAYMLKRYVVEGLDIRVKHYDRAGGVVRLEASLALIEAPVPNLLGLIAQVAGAAAPAVAGLAGANPLLRR